MEQDANIAVGKLLERLDAIAETLARIEEHMVWQRQREEERLLAMRDLAKTMPSGS